jgi:MFS family permease
MGVATFLIGLLPTYEQIGPWAAVALVVLRIAQGFGVGGEWGGAVLMAVEHAPRGARGFYGSWPQIGVPAGLLLSTAVFAVFSATLPEDQLLAWGWRVPFLLSIVLVATGLVIRMRILETPAFVRIKEQAQAVRQPIIEVLAKYPKQVLLAMGVRFAENAAFYIFSVFVLLYATQHAKVDRQTVLYCTLIGAGVELAAIPLFGALSDRIGRRPVYLFGAVMTAVLAFPLFAALDSGSFVLIALALTAAFVLAHGAMYAPQAAFMSEMFDARVRYSGASLGAQLASIFAGGLAPFIGTGLLSAGYGRGAVALYVIGCAAVTIVAVLAASETHRSEVD